MIQTRQVVVLEEEQIRRVAPSVFTVAAHESRTERYTPIPTIDVARGLARIGYFVTSAQQTNARRGRELFTKHLLRFRSEQYLGPNVLGQEFPEIVLVNSFDGTSSYQVMLGIFRLVCTNGHIVRSEDAGTIRVQHRGKIVDAVIEATFAIAEGAGAKLDLIENMKQVQLDRPEQLLLAEMAAKVRYGEVVDDIPATPENELHPAQLLRSRRRVDDSNDLWTVFNRVEENLVEQGGVVVRGERRATPIKAITKSVATKQLLWELAEKFYALKTQG